MKRILAVFLICLLCLSDGALAFGAEPARTGSTKSATLEPEMPTNQLMFLTLAENTALRCNVHGRSKGSELHLDDSSGDNCQFRFDHVKDEDGWYGIKFIENDGIDRFVDVKDRSTAENAELHIWESDDDELKGDKNHHRHWEFYYNGEDNLGNKKYYIKNQNSGLWVGVKKSGSSYSTGDKIVQVKEENRVEWIISPAITPYVDNDEQKLINDGASEVVVNLFLKDTLKSLNRVSNSQLNNTRITPQVLGTTNKWCFTWNADYKAYEIEALSDGGEKTGKVWDVNGESGAPGARINIWDRQSKSRNENTSQLWRLMKTGEEGVYRIQNAKSGLYLNYTYDQNAHADVFCLTPKQDRLFQVSRIGDSSTHDFSYAKDWMADLPNQVLLSDINMPATHDTGTAAIRQDNIPRISLTSCQSLYYGEQLAIGARSFDIRCNATKSNAMPEDVKIIHGSELWQCFTVDNEELTLKMLFDDSVNFLTTHSTEALVFRVSKNAGSEEGIARAIGNFIKNNPDRVWQGGGIPSLGEARGKIVFVRQYNIDTSLYDPVATDGVSIESFGPYLKDWDEADFGKQKYAIEVYNEDGVSFYVQDAYSKYSSGKWDYITGTMKQSTGSDANHTIPAGAWIYNFTSCAVGFPLGLTRDINPKLYRDSESDGAGYIDNRRLGMVMLNFIDEQTSRLIYETNQDRTFATKVTFPETIRIAYGQPLSEAEFDGEYDEDGEWAFEDPGYVPTNQDYTSKKTFKLTFTPKDKRVASVTKDVTITDFAAQPITIKADDQGIQYGDALPGELTWKITKGSLVGNDTTDDFDVRLEVAQYKQEGSAGKDFAINGTAKSKSGNYSLTLEPGKLHVDPKVVGIVWSDTRNLIYTGQPVNVTAALTGVLAGEACSALVEGGNETGPSWSGTGMNPQKYTAKITGLTGADAGNYKLPDEGLSKDYYIRRGTAEDFMFPTKAVLTYGQPLSEAELADACGDGEFHFVENGAKIDDEIKDAGTYAFTMVYKPKDSATERPSASKVLVEVKKKPITVQAKKTEKTYGEETNLDFDVASDDLVEKDGKKDGKDDLGLSLTAGDGDQKASDAGIYRIVKKACASQNYDVSVIPALLTIHKLEAEISWPTQNSYVYTGSPIEISATVTNEIKSDDCGVKLLGTGKTDAGQYTAVAWGLTNKNYTLPKDASKLTWKYEICKAKPGGVTFPASAELTYGECLGQAQYTGGSASIPGQFRFREEGKMPAVSDSGTKYAMDFIPSDRKNYQVQTGQVPVTVKQKPLVINVDSKQKTYNEETPPLTWSMQESQLVGTDSTEEFEIRLSAGEGDKKDCDAGSYAIEGTVAKQNPNYQIEFQKGRLTVKRLAAEIKWNSMANIHVGDPAPSAKITNLVNHDDCKLVVESDGTAEPSWTVDSQSLKIFEARITGLDGADKHNYRLPDDDDGKLPDDDDWIPCDDLTRKYLVMRNNAEDFSMPKGAIMTYGGKLSDAELILAAGDGEFRFVDNRVNRNPIGDNTIPKEAGSATYWMEFIPSDSTKKPEFQEVRVVVRPKKITAAALDTEKTYGERTVLAYDLDESQLVLGDKKDDLSLVLTAISPDKGESGDRPRSLAGTYIIKKGDCNNKNYKVTVTTATLWIHQRLTGVKWCDVSDLHYTGKPVNVTATVTNLVRGDSADVHVVNGDKMEIGTYRAIAESVSNENYRLATTEKAVKERLCPYTIQKGELLAAFPDLAVVTYGKPLASARLIGGDEADGSLTFAEPGALLTVDESGTKVKMIFMPTDTVHYLEQTGYVKVKVDPATVSLAWTGAETRTYDKTASNVQAWAEDLLFDDKASVKVKGGNETKPGTHTATAVSLSNNNYALPKDRTKDYVILDTAAASKSPKSISGSKIHGPGDGDGNGSAGQRTQTGDTRSRAGLAVAGILAVLAVAVMAYLLHRRRS